MSEKKQSKHKATTLFAYIGMKRRVGSGHTNGEMKGGFTMTKHTKKDGSNTKQNKKAIQSIRQVIAKMGKTATIKEYAFIKKEAW